MTAVAEYEPVHFDRLPKFHEAQEKLIPLESKLQRLGAIISSHDADDRVGLALLHRHFEMDADEVLVEEVHPERFVSIGAPRRQPTTGSMMPHLFRASRDADGYRWHPVEYVDISRSPEAMVETFEWFEQQTALLHDVAEALDQEGALDVFGLSLSHGREAIQCAADEILVEDTDSVSRTLTMRPRRSDSLVGAATPTNWRVSDGQVLMACSCMRDQSGSHIHAHTP